MTKEYQIADGKPLALNWWNKRHVLGADGQTMEPLPDSTLRTFQFSLSSNSVRGVNILNFSEGLVSNIQTDSACVIPQTEDTPRFLGIFNEKGEMIGALKKEYEAFNSCELVNFSDEELKNDNDERNYVLKVLETLRNTPYSLRVLDRTSDILKSNYDAWKAKVDSSSFCLNEKGKPCAYKNFKETTKYREDWNSFKFYGEVEDMKDLTFIEDRYPDTRRISEAKGITIVQHHKMRHHFSIPILEKGECVILYTDASKKDKVLIQKTQDGAFTVKGFKEKTSFERLFKDKVGLAHYTKDVKLRDDSTVLIDAEKSFVYCGYYEPHKNYTLDYKITNFKLFLKRNYFSHDFNKVSEQLVPVLRNYSELPENTELLNRLEKSGFIKVTDRETGRGWGQFIIDLFQYLFAFGELGELMGKGTIKYNEKFKTEDLNKLMTAEEPAKAASFSR